MSAIAALRGPAALLAALLTVAGCAPAPRATGTALTIGQQQEPMSLNPALENGTSSMEWGLLLFNYLVKFDDRGRLVGDVATAVPSLGNGGISRDGLTVTYHLRRGIRFADGTPLTARDCAWSIDAINNSRNNVQSRYGYDRIARAEARGDATLVLHLRRPFAPLLTLVEAPEGFPILPAHLLAALPDFNRIAFDGQPIGGGPYVVTRWVRGDRVEMRANPYYWQGKPKIERLTIRFVADPQTAINLLRTHELGGYFNEQDAANYPLLEKIAGYRVTTTPIGGVGAIIFNTADPQTSDPRVRHALVMALDIPRLVASTYRGALTFDDGRPRALRLGLRSGRISRHLVRSGRGARPAGSGRLARRAERDARAGRPPARPVADHPGLDAGGRHHRQHDHCGRERDRGTRDVEGVQRHAVRRAGRRRRPRLRR